MSWQHTVYVYPTLLATTLSLALAGYAVHYSRHRERALTIRIFAAMNVAVAVWTAFAALKLLSTDPATKLLTYRLLHVGSSAVPPLLLLFALAYTDRTRWVRPRVAAGLFVPAVVFLALLFSNPYDLAIVESRIIDVHGLTVMRTENGPAHLAFSSVYSLVVGLLTIGIVLYEVYRRGRSYLAQASLLGLAIVTPLSVSLFTAAAIPPFHLDNVNFVPAATAVSMTAIGVATVRYRLLDLLPIAYTAAVEHSPDGVLVVDDDGRIIHANESVGSLLGRSSSVVGSQVDDVVPDYDPTNASGDVVDLDASRGGAEFLDVRSQPLERRGAVVGWVVVLRDVTERRRRERDLEAFTGVVSHDLQQPLQTVDHYLQLFEDRYGDAFDEDATELFEVAQSNNRRLQAMISDLLEYSKIDAREATFQPVDIDRVVADALDGLRFSIEDPCGDESAGAQLFPPAVENGTEERRWGTLEAFRAAFSDGFRLDDGDEPCLSPDDGVCLVLEYELPADATWTGDLETGLEFEFYAEQCRHVSEADVKNPFAPTNCPDVECPDCVELGKVDVENDEIQVGSYEFDELYAPFDDDECEYELEALAVTNKNDDGAETICGAFRLLRDGAETTELPICEIRVAGGPDPGSRGPNERTYRVDPPTSRTRGQLCTAATTAGRSGKLIRPAISHLTLSVCSDAVDFGGDEP